MQRRTVLSSVVVLLLAACSANSGRPTTSLDPAAEPATTIEAIPSTTSTAQSPTSTEPMGPVDICRRGLVWEVDVVYSAPCFVVPVSFEVTHEGWGSGGAGEDWVKVRWQGEDQGLRVRVAVVEFRSTSPADVLDRIAGIERISEVSARMDVLVAGLPGLMADFEGAPEPVGDTMPDPCTGDSPVWFGGTRFGHPLLSAAGPGDVIGVGACHVVRVWAVQVGERTLTILGGTIDPDRHQEAVARIGELFEGMSFESS